MVAQGGTFIFLAENAPALQFGNDKIDKIVQSFRQKGQHDNEAV